MEVCMNFEKYVALGDSISISFYAGIDYGERYNCEGISGLGAAALLFENNDKVWPSFAGQDLSTNCSGISMDYHAADGATSKMVLENQLPFYQKICNKKTLITLTAGGNDLLFMMGKNRQSCCELFSELLRNMETILQRIEEFFPDNMIILSTVYDPSDGLPHIMWRNYEEDHLWFHKYNDTVREICQGRGNIVCADLYKHCFGHGPSQSDSWYYATIEPGLLGAHEIRKVWWQLLNDV